MYIDYKIYYLNLKKLTQYILENKKIIHTEW